MNEEPSLTIDSLKQAIELIKKPDPLEEKGIPKDWVCVLHPRLEYLLKDHFKVKDVNPQTLIGFMYNSIERITGRKTFIIAAAPDNKIEYMPKITMYIRYADYFISIAELRKSSEDEEIEADE